MHLALGSSVSFSCLFPSLSLSLSHFIQHVEDRNLLAGSVAMFSGQYGKAQELFLASSDPNAALEVC